MEEVDAPEYITLFVDAFVDAGGTYDADGFAADVDPEGAGDELIVLLYLAPEYFTSSLQQTHCELDPWHPPP